MDDQNKPITTHNDSQPAQDVQPAPVMNVTPPAPPFVSAPPTPEDSISPDEPSSAPEPDSSPSPPQHVVNHPTALEDANTPVGHQPTPNQPVLSKLVRVLLIIIVASVLISASLYFYMQNK